MNKDKKSMVDWLKENKIIFETIVMVIISIAGIVISFWNYKVSESQFKLNEWELEQVMLEKQPYFYIDSEFSKLENGNGKITFEDTYSIKNSGNVYRNINIIIESYIIVFKDEISAFKVYFPISDLDLSDAEIKKFYFENEKSLIEEYKDTFTNDLHFYIRSYAIIDYIDYKNNHQQVILNLDSDNIEEEYMPYDEVREMSENLEKNVNEKLKKDLFRLEREFNEKTILNILNYINKN